MNHTILSHIKVSFIHSAPVRGVRLIITALCLIFISAATLSSCSEGIPMVNLGIEDNYRIARMSPLWLQPALDGESYRWIDSDGKVISRQRDFCFISASAGDFTMTFEVDNNGETFSHSFSVTVVEEEIAYSPFISEVIEYYPAPGQFVNTMPQYEEGDSYSDMVDKCTREIADDNRGMVSLGAFGGYITFRFDHTVVNVAGENDLMILGNAIYQTAASDPRKGGSCEPGIVMVSLDRNGNGLPDDPWFELAGSEHPNPSTRPNLSITYNQPDPDREIISGGNISDEYYIGYLTSDGEQGYIAKNIYHRQEYFPKWVKENSLTFSGTCLPANGVDPSGRGSYYILYAFDWGYVDNHPNNLEKLCCFDISNAVDQSGHPVHLPGADFIRIYTGISQSCGWVGETSTEVSHARDLHL